MEDKNSKNEKEIQEETEMLVKKLNEMTKEEINELYLKFKKEVTALAEEPNKEIKGLASTNENVKGKDLNNDDVCKIVFGSCLASMIGGATLGGLFGQNMTEVVGITAMTSIYGTIFLSLLYDSKPIKGMVNAIKKCALKRKVAKLDKQQKELPIAKIKQDCQQNLGRENG